MKADDSTAMGDRALPGTFTTTHWSVVMAVGQGDSTQATEALQKLCQSYWYPLYSYARGRGHAKHDAEDLIQGFFAMLLKREALQKVVPGRGKFRSFLLTALNHYLADQHDWHQAQKRGGGEAPISLDAQDAEHRYQLEPKDGATPERLYERSWATTLIDRALEKLRQDYEAEGKRPLFEQLRCFVVAGAESPRYAELGPGLGLSEDAVRKAVKRLQARYGKAIREEIAHTVTSAGEIESELRHLCSVWTP